MTISYAIDGAVQWTEGEPPYYDNGDFHSVDTTTLRNGTHQFTVTARAFDGSTATVTTTATVAN